MNSTFTGSDAFLGATVTKVTGLSYLARFRPELELLWVLLSYSPFLVKTFQFTSSKFARARAYPHAPLVVHIFSGPMLVLRYHARYAAQRAWPRPEAADLLLFSAFSLSSFLLEARRSRAPHATPTVRAGFQSAVLIQAVLFGTSWARGGDPAPFRAVVKFMNWFASFRATAALAGLVDPRLAAPGCFALRMELTMLASGCFAVWEAGVPAGVPAFLGLVAGFMVVERAVAEAVWRSVPLSSCEGRAGICARAC